MCNVRERSKRDRVTLWGIEMIKNVFIGLGVIVGLLALTWVIQGNNFFLYQTFAPKMAEVRRDVYEETHSYRQGMIQNMHNLQTDYVQAEPGHRGGLASVILLRAGDIADPESYPADVQAFISCIRRSQAQNNYADSCAPA